MIVRKALFLIFIVFFSILITACWNRVDLSYEDTYHLFSENFNISSYNFFENIKKQSTLNTIWSESNLKIWIENKFINWEIYLDFDSKLNNNTEQNLNFGQSFGSFDLVSDIKSDIEEYKWKLDLQINWEFAISGSILYLKLLNLNYNFNLDKSVLWADDINQQVELSKSIIPTILNKWFSIDLNLLQQISLNPNQVQSIKDEDMFAILESFSNNIKKYPFLKKSSEMIDIDGKNWYNVDIDPIALSNIIKNTVNETRILEVLDMESADREQLSQNIEQNINDMVDSFRKSNVKLQLQILSKKNAILLRNSNDLVWKIWKWVFDISTKSDKEKVFFSMKDWDMMWWYDWVEWKIDLKWNIDLGINSEFDINLKIDKTPINIFFKDEPIDLSINTKSKIIELNKFEMIKIDWEIVDIWSQIFWNILNVPSDQDFDDEYLDYSYGGEYLQSGDVSDTWSQAEIYTWENIEEQTIMSWTGQ